MALLFQFLDRTDGIFHFGREHAVGVERNVASGEGFAGGREVVGIGFARHFEDGDGDLFRKLGAVEEPLGVRPALQNLFGVFVALVGQLFDIVEGVVDQQRVLELVGRFLRDLFVLVFQRVDEGLDVETAQHHTEHLHGTQRRDRGRLRLALDDIVQKRRFDVGGIVDSRGNAVFEKIEKLLLFDDRNLFEQFDHLRRLLRVQRKRRNAQRLTLFHMLFIFGHKTHMDLLLMVWIRLF